MRPPTPLGAAGVAFACAAVAAGVLVVAPEAGAAACASPVRYAASTNTLYIVSGELDLPAVKGFCAAAPLDVVPGSPRTWLLRANLVVQNGATLRVRGGDAGEVDALRLASPASGSPTEVVELTANHGTLLFDRVTVTSWDPATSAPDTDPGVPSGVSGGRGRAFVRALSVYDRATATARESRMDILSSTFSDLGYYGAEAYGVSYKARGCDANPASWPVCDALDVRGSQRGSRFLRNYMGTYTYNARDMVFDGNEYAHNVSYGLDPHDDSDHLTITNNRAHHNGNHGIICSQRCDHLVIRGNTVESNGLTPYLLPGDDDPNDNQVHGIMLHRGVTDTVVEGNTVRDHANGAGIAVFDSFGNTIRDNVLERNDIGLRTSVGSRDNVYEGNRVSASGQYAVNAFPGVKDTAVYGVPSSRPTREVFRDNLFDGSASNLVKLLGTDGFSFADNRVTGTVGSVLADSSTGLRWDSEAAPGSGLNLRSGSSPSTATLRLPQGVSKVSPGPAGTVTVVAPDRRLFETGPVVGTTVTPAGATTVLDTALMTAAGTTTATLTPRPVTVTPTAGSVGVRLRSYTSATARTLTAASERGTAFTVRWAGLTPGDEYVIRVDGRVLSRVRADAGGVVSWSYTETAGAERAFTVRTS